MPQQLPDCQIQGTLSDSHLPLASVSDHSLLEAFVMFSLFYSSDFLFHLCWLFFASPLNISGSDFNPPLATVVALNFTKVIVPSGHILEAENPLPRKIHMC